MAVAGLRLAECGTNGAGSPSTSRPYGPTFAQINPEGRTQSGREWGRQSGGCLLYTSDAADDPSKV